MRRPYRSAAQVSKAAMANMQVRRRYMRHIAARARRRHDDRQLARYLIADQKPSIAFAAPLPSPIAPRSSFPFAKDDYGVVGASHHRPHGKSGAPLYLICNCPALRRSPFRRPCFAIDGASYAGLDVDITLEAQMPPDRRNKQHRPVQIAGAPLSDPWHARSSNNGKLWRPRIRVRAGACCALWTR